MTWFFIALIAPFLWAIVNISDHYLVAKYTQKEKEKSSGGLVLFSSLIGIFIAFGIFIFTKGIFRIPLIDIFLLVCAGVLTVIWILFYLYSIEIEEISAVVPWFLLSPVFGYILGYFILGETLSIPQIIGSIVIILGSLLISFDFAGEKRRLRKKMIIYINCACLVIAICGVIFKYVTIEGNFWVSSFWEYLGLGVCGIVLYIFIPKYKGEFHYMNRAGGKRIFLVNVVSELASVTGNILTNFALLLAPVAMVFMVSSFQPAMVLVLTIVGTKFFPHIINENISRKALVPKIIAIFIMVIGSLLLFI